jgi:hypothetical protein
VSIRFVEYTFSDSIHCVSIRFVSICFVSIRFVSIRFVSIRFVSIHFVNAPQKQKTSTAVPLKGSLVRIRGCFDDSYAFLGTFLGSAWGFKF